MPPSLPPDQRPHTEEEPEDSIEKVELTDEESEVEELEDGSAIVRVNPGSKVEKEDPEFYANLADGPLDQDELNRVSHDLIEQIEDDKKAREQLDTFYAEGIKRTGIAEPAPGGADFEGASKLTHPVLMEACVDFGARVVKEIFPSSGPVKSHIPGEVTPEKIEKADRKTRFMNWQTTQQMPGLRPAVEQVCVQTGLAGSGYIKLEQDFVRNRPTASFVPMEAVYLPASASTFWDSKRKTHVFTLNEVEYRERLQTGRYIDLDIPPESLPPQSSEAKEAADKAQGLDDQGTMNLDGLREFYESYVWLALSADNEGVSDEDSADWVYRPYIVTIDVQSEKIVAIYRNWVESDPDGNEIEWLIYFGLIPWRGPYCVGFNHLLGGLAGAATGALRGILDAALLQNSNSGWKLDGEASGQTVQTNQTGVQNIRGSTLPDDIRKVVMPNPFPGPSNVLFQMLNYISTEAKGVIQMTFDKVGGANTPVGTLMGQIEQGLSVFSSIHQRFHYSMGRALKTLHVIDQLYLDDEETYVEAGELMVKRTDFDGPMDVIPVSDPNVFSEVQRMAQTQMVVQRSDQYPQLYNKRKVEEWLLKALKIPSAVDLLVEEPKPKKMNAVNENVASTAGRPISAFPEQDHLAHLQTHIDFMMNPIFGMLSVMMPIVLPNLLNHLKEHLAFWYVDQVSKQVEEILQGQGLDEDEIKEIMRSQDQAETRLMDSLLAQVSGRVLALAQQGMSEIPAVIQRATQILQSTQPKPLDPNAVAQANIRIQEQTLQLKGQELQQKGQQAQQDNVVKMAEIQRKTQEGQAKIQAEQERTQMELATGTQDLELRRASQQLEGMRTMADIQASAQEADHRQLELDLRAAEAETGRRQLESERMLATMQLGEEADRLERQQDFNEALATDQLRQQAVEAERQRQHEGHLASRAEDLQARIEKLGNLTQASVAEDNNLTRIAVARIQASSQERRAKAQKSKPGRKSPKSS